MTITLSKTGEIGDFLDVDQMQPAKTQFACGYFSFAIIRAMAPVGQAPTQSAQQMIAEAEAWYAQDHGTNAISNADGMSLQEEYDLIVRAGWHYQASSLDLDTIRAWVKLGYPILLTLSESSVVDLALAGNPYPWNPAGNHIIVISGVTADDNFLVRDPANCTDLYNPNSLRPGPRKYDASRLQIWTATVVVPPWRPRPPAGFDPKKESLMITPAGWHDDGTTLTAPNGHKVIRGFRQRILGDLNWNPANQPQEEEYHTDQVLLHNASVGPGQRQTFRDGEFWYTDKLGVVWEPFLGLEIKAAYDTIAALMGQLAKVQPPAPTINAADAILALKQLQVTQTTEDATIAQILKDLGAAA